MQPRKGLYLMSNFSTLDLVDRESLTRRLMTLVGENHEVHQRGQKRFELVVLLLAEARMEQGFDAADDAGGGHDALGAGLRKQLFGLQLEALCEVVHEFDTTPNRRRAGRPRLDHHRAGGIGFAGGEAQQRFEPEADSVAPDVPPFASRGFEFLAQTLGADVESGEEAIFFVGEVFVESGAGYAGPVDHVLDVGFQVAEVGGGAEHRYDQTLSLNRPDQVRGELADPGWELSAAVRKQLQSRLDLLGGPIIT